MSAKHYFAVRYGDIVVLLYHENMQSVRELLFENSRKEKTLKRFLEYCYMIDVKGNRQIIMRSDIKLPQPFASWSNSL